MTIGIKLRKAIREQGRQVDFLRKYKNMFGEKISPSRLSNYLSGSRKPETELLNKMCECLGTDINTFLNGSGERLTEEQKAKAIMVDRRFVVQVTLTDVFTGAKAKLDVKPSIAGLALLNLSEITEDEGNNETENHSYIREKATA
jgi:transcriptional regulator with XRE-family HTH domain